MSTAGYIQNLLATFPLRQPVLRQIVQSLKFLPGSKGLDVGCGIGQPAMLLAEVLGPGVILTGVDISDEILARARSLVRRSGLSRSIEFQKGSMDSLPFDENVFDWAWSVDCAGSSARSRDSALLEMIRVVKPGGQIALIAWSSQQFLAGYPRLEARLNATSAGMAPYRVGDDPEMHFLQTAARLHNSGIERVRVRSFLGDVCGPVSDVLRKALAAFFTMRWGGAKTEVSDSEWRLFCRLTDPDSEEFLPDRQDYYGIFSYRVFTGIVDDYTNNSEKHLIWEEQEI